jgi:putative sugar O-methyltransferase
VPAIHDPSAAAGSDLPNLRPMLDEMRDAPEIVRPSAFWEHFGERHVAELETQGFAEFKRTVNRDYFQFLQVDPRFDQFRAMMVRWMRHPRLRVAAADFGEQLPGPSYGRVLDRLKSKSYGFYLAQLFEYARGIDRLGLLDRFEEPQLGHPVAIEYQGRAISEDLCNSALELNSIMSGLPAPPSGAGVLELGGGYGRLAWLFLSAYPGTRYVLVDIPPALAIAERYLETLLPDRRIFSFRRFERFEQIETEWSDAEIAFLTPNQLDLLPPLQLELFVNVSSLHEMAPEQISHYLRVVAHHTAGYFYTKQWRRSTNAHDGVVVRREDYPIPPAWQVVFDRTPPVQKLFFETMYRMPDVAGRAS